MLVVGNCLPLLLRFCSGFGVHLYWRSKSVLHGSPSRRTLTLMRTLRFAEGHPSHDQVPKHIRLALSKRRKIDPPRRIFEKNAIEKMSLSQLVENITFGCFLLIAPLNAARSHLSNGVSVVCRFFVVVEIHAFHWSTPRHSARPCSRQPLIKKGRNKGKD